VVEVEVEIPAGLEFLAEEMAVHGMFQSQEVAALQVLLTLVEVPVVWEFGTDRL
jgi:hypothetical protein